MKGTTVIMRYEGYIFTPEYTFVPGCVITTDNIISDIQYYDSDEGLEDYIIPGLIDLHVHGAAGHDICESTPEALSAIAEYQISQGIAGFCGATMTLPLPDIAGICHKLGPINIPEYKGIYLEGPFINEKRAGAQDPGCILNPDISIMDDLINASLNTIRFAVVAPEKSGAPELIRYLSSLGIRVSLGHTESNYKECCAAADSGADQITHLYNAMPPFDKREPGPVGAALDNNMYAELICDGYHVHPSVIRGTFRLFEDDRIILISDSTMATGMPDGYYSLGGQKVYVKNKKVTLSGGALAGSASNLRDCLINAISFGVPACKAIKAATITPAIRLGIDKHYGTIEKGKCGILATLPRSLFH